MFSHKHPNSEQTATAKNKFRNKNIKKIQLISPKTQGKNENRKNERKRKIQGKI